MRLPADQTVAGVVAPEKEKPEDVEAAAQPPARGAAAPPAAARCCGAAAPAAGALLPRRQGRQEGRCRAAQGQEEVTRLSFLRGRTMCFFTRTSSSVSATRAASTRPPATTWGGWRSTSSCDRQAGSPAEKKKFQGEFAKGTLAGHDCILLRPETFMNESGRSVQPAMALFPRRAARGHRAPRRARPPFRRGAGEVRRRSRRAQRASLAGLHLGTADFVRVRMGIGRPPAGFTGDVADYVLVELRSGRARAFARHARQGRQSGGARSSP